MGGVTAPYNDPSNIGTPKFNPIPRCNNGEETGKESREEAGEEEVSEINTRPSQLATPGAALAGCLFFCVSGYEDH